MSQRQPSGSPLALLYMFRAQTKRRWRRITRLRTINGRRPVLLEPFAQFWGRPTMKRAQLMAADPEVVAEITRGETYQG